MDITTALFLLSPTALCLVIGCCVFLVYNRKLHSFNIFYIEEKQKNQFLQERITQLEDALFKNEEKLEEERRGNLITLSRFTEQSVRLEEEKKQANEKVEFLLKAKEELTSQFKALSSDTLQGAQNTFIQIAKETFEQYQIGFKSQINEKHQAFETIVKPLKESLEKVDVKIQELEKSRVGAYSSITEQLKTLSSTQVQLQGETANLVKALRSPNVRGQWGEIQLKRVVELAGMIEYCDFETQRTQDTEDGKIRPDLIIKLPNSRTVIVDAKAPLQAYLEAVGNNDETHRLDKLKEHAKQLRKHLMQLGEKNYWEQFTRTPEFVILFLPGESLFSAALEHDPSLLEYGVEKRVLIATPTTLIALLRTVAFGWREDVVAKHAEMISDLGHALYDRLLTMVEHFQKLQKSLVSATESYNRTVGCFEGRVLVAARKFQDMGVGESKPELSALPPIENMTRELNSSYIKKEGTISLEVPLILQDQGDV